MQHQNLDSATELRAWETKSVTNQMAEMSGALPSCQNTSPKLVVPLQVLF